MARAARACSAGGITRHDGLIDRSPLAVVTEASVVPSSKYTRVPSARASSSRRATAQVLRARRAVAAIRALKLAASLAPRQLPEVCAVNPQPHARALAAWPTRSCSRSNRPPHELEPWGPPGERAPGARAVLETVGASAAPGGSNRFRLALALAGPGGTAPRRAGCDRRPLHVWMPRRGASPVVRERCGCPSRRRVPQSAGRPRRLACGRPSRAACDFASRHGLRHVLPWSRIRRPPPA